MSLKPFCNVDERIRFLPRPLMNEMHPIEHVFTVKIEIAGDFVSETDHFHYLLCQAST
jgi:hypothetical protein